MNTYKLYYYFWNNPDSEKEMIVKADDIIKAKQIGAKRIKAKFHNCVNFCWSRFEKLS